MSQPSYAIPIPTATAQSSPRTAFDGTTALGFVALGLVEDSHQPQLRLTVGVLDNTAAILGPSLGHWYAGKLVTPGLVLRLGGLATIGIVLVAGGDRINEDTAGLVIPGPLAAVSMIGAGTVWDLATLPRRVRAYNRSNFAVVPTDNNGGAGLALSGRF